jgi:recombination protein RecA
MSQALRKLTGNIKRSNSMVIFINQIRMKIGVMFGSPETTTGGNALKFYASVRLDVRRIGALKDGEQVVGNRTRVKVVKNKMAAPFRETEFDVGYGQGISRAGEIIDLGVEAGVLEKSGAWIAHGSERLGNGREAAKQYLVEHPELLRELRGKLLARAGIGAGAQAGVSVSAGTTTAPAASSSGEEKDRRPAVRKVA